MSLRFIYGRAGTGKTRVCLEEIKEKMLSGFDKPLILLVPEQYTLEAEKELIGVIGKGGLIHAEVLSFRRLAHRILNTAGGITYPYVSKAGKCMLISSVLNKVKPKIVFFEKLLESKGFINSISTLITEFKRYNITPEHLYKLDFDSDLSLKQKLYELAIIYEEFEKVLKTRYRDPDDDITLAAKRIVYTDIYNGAHIWIDGFDGFTPQEYRFIAELMNRAEILSVSLCTDCLVDERNFVEVDVFASVKKAYLRLVKIAAENKVKVEPAFKADISKSYRDTKSVELKHLENNIYSYPYNVYRENANNIKLFASVNLFEEVDAVARDIVRLCREKNLRYRDIAVVTGALEEYETFLDTIFREYEIPVFIDRKEKLTNNPLILMVLSILEIFTDNWSYEAVFRYLKTGFSNISREEVDLLENYVLACGIRGKDWTIESDWEFIPDMISREDKENEEQDNFIQKINEIRKRTIEPLLSFREKTKGRHKAEEFCESLYEFLCSIGVPEKLEDYIEKFKIEGKLALANQYSQIWDILIDVLDQIVEIMGDEAVSTEKFAKVLEIGLSEYEVGTIPASLDQVLAGSLERSKSHAVKALYVIGANDGAFPSLNVQEGILTDRDRELIGSMGIELSSDTRTKAFEGQYQVYKALSTPKDYLWISWAIADQEGRALRPSMIISKIKKIFPSISCMSNVINPAVTDSDIELVAAKTNAFRHLVSNLRKKADGKNINPQWSKIYKWYLIQNDWKDKCNLIRFVFSYKNESQAVSKDKIRQLYGNPVVTSVSKIEKYSSCPYAFFLQYGLKAKERKIYSLKPPDIGTFMHAVIEEFTRVVIEENISWRSIDKEWCENKVSEIIDSMLEKMKGKGLASSKRYSSLALKLKRVVAKSVWIISEHIRRGNFEPHEYEVGFGRNQEYPPLLVELDTGEKVLLEGRIDRIDTLKKDEATYIRIIDYKSGKKNFKLSEVLYGLQLQLIAYMDAVWNGFESKTHMPVIPSGILYFSIDDPMINCGSRPYSDEELEQSIIKAFKMKGLVLKDVELIREMDNSISGVSMIIPAGITKDGVPHSNGNYVDKEQLQRLRAYVNKLLKDFCTEMLKGDVSIKPYKKDKITACSFCGFSAICQFDNLLSENKYKIYYDIKDKDVWEKITKE